MSKNQAKRPPDRHRSSHRSSRHPQHRPAARPSRAVAAAPPTYPPLRIPTAVYLVGGWALAAIAFFGDFSGHQSDVVAQSFGQSFKRDLCQEVIQPNASLSREDLAALLTIPERAPKAELREVVAEPYCQLPSLEVRADAPARREAYPLAFDPQIWLVVLYEGEEYAGYAFRFAQ